MKTVELLAPAGEEATARAALFGGADAVYLGLTRFSARSGAENFGYEALRRTADLAHLLGGRVYVCLNTLVKDGETDDFFASVRAAWNNGADAILLQDLFLGKKLKERYPALELHLSTQAGCCNERGAAFAAECGFSRVVLARETPLSEIEKIAGRIETEVFVQGALCTCFSGQCYLSSFAGGNSGNRGRCKQPCRKKYSIDRSGFETPAYALSSADLCVGEKISALLNAGVCSFKIEGRMRRSEYVAAAANYYRTLINGGSGERELSDLRRAYNRGDYTHGLSFGQEPGFLSRNVQGHIGEKVGVMRDGEFCESRYPARKGDGFKILRGGREAGGGAFRAAGKGGFFLSSPEKLHAGDEVRLTTDSALSSRLPERKRALTLSLRVVAGEPSEAVCGDFVFRGGIPERAKSAPLTAEELQDCFRKTDGLPFSVSFAHTETRDAFLPKSALNAFRRDFYAALSASLLPVREPLPGLSVPEPPAESSEECRTAIIAEDLHGLKADILIYKPRDYGAIDPAEVRAGMGKKYLYLPPFFTSEDEKSILPSLPLFDGIYCEGYYGFPLAEAYGKELFSGTGCNLSNRFAVSEAKARGAAVALSKELTAREQRALEGAGSFSLREGAIKVMDLCYCPFSLDCGACDRRTVYTLTDEEGRKFPLRRYRMTGKGCRFELFNCAPLSASGGGGALTDLTVRFPEGTVPTRGHSERSLP